MVFIHSEAEYNRMTAPTTIAMQELEPGTLSWKHEGKCLGMGIKADNVFFPDRGASNREAKAICRGCPVQVECLEYALLRNEKFGVWGGTTERERVRLRRQRRKG